jgi:predicted thioredoxin/glutaredoxin
MIRKIERREREREKEKKESGVQLLAINFIVNVVLLRAHTLARSFTLTLALSQFFFLISIYSSQSLT